MAFSKLDGKGIDLSSNVLTSFASTGIDDNASSSTAITIDADGDVGIGTTDPAAPLHVKVTEGSTGETDPIARFERFTTGDNAYLDITIDNSTNMIGFQSTGTSDGGFSFGVATSNLATITSAGNMGIGTDTPTNSANYKTLQISGTTGGQFLLGRPSQYDFFLYTSSTESTIGSNVGQHLRFLTNSTGNSNERMRITSAGNVAIGTGTGVTASGARFQVNTSDNAVELVGAFTNENMSFNTAAGVYITIGDGATASRSMDIGLNTDGTGEFDGSILVNEPGGSLDLGVANATQAVRITSAGKLLVKETTFNSGYSSFANMQISDPTAPGLVINTTTAGASNYGRLAFTVGNSTGNEGLIRYNSNDYHMSFWTDAGERMRIDDAGKVGIGTTSNNTYNLLQVSGVTYSDMLTTSIYGVIGHNLLYANSSWRYGSNGYGYGWAQTGTNGSDLVLYRTAVNSSGHGTAVTGLTETMRIHNDGEVELNTPRFFIDHSNGGIYKNLGTVMGNSSTNRYIHVKTNAIWGENAMTMFRITGYLPYNSYSEGYLGGYFYGVSSYRSAPYGPIYANQGAHAVAHSMYYSQGTGAELILVLDWPTPYNGVMIEHIGAGSTYGDLMRDDLQILAYTHSTSTTGAY